MGELTTGYRSTASYVNDTLIPISSLPDTGYPIWNREMTALLDAMRVRYKSAIIQPGVLDPPHDRILYVGCGRRLPFIDCWCCDLDPQVGQGIEHFVHADAHDLPFEDNTFDWVLSSHTIEHLTDQETAIGEMVRVTRVGGLIGAILPDVRWTGGRDPDHKREWSLDAFADQFRAGITSGDAYRLVASDVAEPEYSFIACWVKESD